MSSFYNSFDEEDRNDSTAPLAGAFVLLLILAVVLGIITYFTS